MDIDPNARPSYLLMHLMLHHTHASTGLVAVEYADVADPLVTIERAVTANSFYEQLPFPAMNYSRGDVDKAMASAKHKITGAK